MKELNKSMLEYHFQNGDIHSFVTIYKSSKWAVNVKFKRVLYENGVIYLEVPYKNGYEHGIEIKRHKNGSVIFFQQVHGKKGYFGILVIFDYGYKKELSIITEIPWS